MEYVICGQNDTWLAHRLSNVFDGLGPYRWTTIAGRAIKFTHKEDAEKLAEKIREQENGEQVFVLEI